VEGFLKALDHIDEIINIIRSNREIARSKEIIIERFGFSTEQADAIVEMRLRALSGLERERLEDEYAKLRETIAYLKSILGDENILLGVIRKEILIIRDKFGDERRTQIVADEGEIVLEDLIDEETCVITLTHMDYVKRLPLDTYKSQRRGGKGVVGLTTRDEDIIKQLFIASTHDDIIFITTNGRAYRLRAYQIPVAGRSAKGSAIVNLLKLSAGEKVASMIVVNNYESGYLTMITKKGIVKKTPLLAYANINKAGLIAMTLKEGDELVKTMMTNDEDDIFMASHEGKGLRFSAQSIRSTGRQAAGVMTINLAEGDYVVGAEIVAEDMKLLLVSEKGYGKCTHYDEFGTKGRRGKGMAAYKCSEKTGKLVGITSVNDKEELMLINSDGVIIRTPVSGISTVGRNASGVKLIGLDEGSQVVGLAKVPEEDVADADADAMDNE